MRGFKMFNGIPNFMIVFDCLQQFFNRASLGVEGMQICQNFVGVCFAFV